MNTGLNFCNKDSSIASLIVFALNVFYKVIFTVPVFVAVIFFGSLCMFEKDTRYSGSNKKILFIIISFYQISRPIFFLKSFNVPTFFFVSMRFSLAAFDGLVALRGLGLIRALFTRLFIFFITSCLFPSCVRSAWLFTSKSPSALIFLNNFSCNVFFSSSPTNDEDPICQ